GRGRFAASPCGGPPTPPSSSVLPASAPAKAARRMPRDFVLEVRDMFPPLDGALHAAAGNLCRRRAAVSELTATRAPVPARVTASLRCRRKAEVAGQTGAAVLGRVASQT